MLIALLSRFYAFSAEEILNMSSWYAERFVEQITNIEGWMNGKALQSLPLVELLVDRQNLRDGVYYG